MKYQPQSKKPGYIVLIVLTLVFMIIAFLFNILYGLSGKTRTDMGIFTRVDDYAMFTKYPLPIDLDVWAGDIWTLIYCVQLAWISYTQSLICRKNKFNTGYLYCSPQILPPAFFFIYIMGLILNVTMLFCLDSEFIAASFVSFAGIVLCLCICFFFSLRYLWDYETEVYKVDMWVNIILVQNGICLYLVWACISAVIGFARILSYEASVTVNTSCYIVLVLFLAKLLIYFFSDILVATTRLRYVISPYVATIVAFAAMVSRNWVSDSGVQVFVVVLLTIAVLMLIGKIVSIVFYSRVKPFTIADSNPIRKLPEVPSGNMMTWSAGPVV